MTPENITKLIKIAFNLGVDYGKRYERLYVQANLDNAFNAPDFLHSLKAGGKSVKEIFEKSSGNTGDFIDKVAFLHAKDVSMNNKSIEKYDKKYLKKNTHIDLRENSKDDEPNFMLIVCELDLLVKEKQKYIDLLEIISKDLNTQKS